MLEAAKAGTSAQPELLPPKLGTPVPRGAGSAFSGLSAHLGAAI